MSGLDLNPREVLEHLYELGYTNISPEQLREFVKDLKKLIKYDQRMREDMRRNKFCGINLKEEEEKDGKVEKVAVAHPTPRQIVSPITAELAENNMRMCKTDANTRLNAVTSSRNVGSTSSDVLDSNQRSLRTRSETRDNIAKYQTANSNRPCSAKESVAPMRSSSCSGRDDSRKHTANSNRPCSAKENVPPTRSSSFIRPWKYQCGGQRPGCSANRSDPVALYHKYQALWQQNKIPGEENHSNLRWNIREKMLGQDPHPRPISQASSLESMPRRRVTRM